MEPRHYYTLFMVLAALVFVGVRASMPRLPPLARRPLLHRLALPAAAFVGGSLASKLPFIFMHEDGPASWQAWSSDGKTVTAALVGGYLGVEIAKRLLNIRFKTGDTFALPLALALAVGRWGCFFNGCCYGVPTDLSWGVAFDVEGTSMVCHPTQIYESLFHLMTAVVLLLLMRTGQWKGHLVQFQLIVYCAFRFLTEIIRPEPEWFAGLTFYQCVSLAFGGALALQWFVETRTRSQHRNVANCS